MKVIRTLALIGVTALGAAMVSAQSASAPAAGPGPGPRASGPGPGPGMGMGPGARGASGPGTGMPMGPGMRGGARGPGRSGADFTPGWPMMSPKEREEHRARMQAAKTYDECKALQQQHHDQMAARAKERGASAPLAQPRRDACAGLKR